jgi:hypothetical protein
MLELLTVVITLSAPDLELMEKAYTDSLNYHAVDRGQVVEELAATWGAPRMVGREFVLMQPESNADFYLRFVQSDPIDGYGAMKTFGWNATEILVQDPDELAQRFRESGSLFEIVGEPRPLSATSPIRAMQVVGPADEVVYLTRIPPADPDAEGPVRASATTYVDRPFIVILGGPDIDAMRMFYKEQFGFQVSEPGMARMTVLNKAHGFDIERTHPLAMARISPEFAIEIDGYPETATTRAHRYGELPPAMAMIGFEVTSLEPFRSQLLTPAQSLAMKPYEGRSVGVVRGAADELIELIETP